MNKYALGIFLVIIATMTLGLALGMKYSAATLLFGFVAGIAAPIAVHRVPDKNWSIALLFALAIFASFPFKKLFQIEGFVAEIPVLLIYAAILWLIGLGWRRSWQ